MSYGLSKSRLLSFRQCPKRLWLQIHRPELAVYTEQTTAAFGRGQSVGAVAQALYPDGILIETDQSDLALVETERLLQAQPDRPLFEAALAHDGVLVRADVLIPEAGGYRMEEVKASTQVKEYHLVDCAVQTWVCQQSGLPITRVMLAHVDTRFVYPGNGDYRGLLHPVDVTTEVSTLLPDVPRWVAEARATLAGQEPGIAPGPHCSTPFACPFVDSCQRGLPVVETPFPVASLPYGRNLVPALVAAGYRDLREVPAERLSNPQHQRMHRVALSGAPELDTRIAEELRDLPYPRYYLDFETIQFAVPVWAGTRPYQQVGFQWSCHSEPVQGDLHHTAFLEDHGQDPRRGFAEQLIKAVGDRGPIFVYNAGFEGSVIRQLAADLADLASPLHAIAARLLDLLPLTRQSYYHPDMQGSWSIKSVLPTIAPELDYSDLAVQHGSMAQDAYVELIDPGTPALRKDALRQGLLDYCHRDTLATVRLAWHLEGREPTATSPT